MLVICQHGIPNIGREGAAVQEINLNSSANKKTVSNMFLLFHE